jgi:hypothetical protein
MRFLTLIPLLLLPLVACKNSEKPITDFRILVTSIDYGEVPVDAPVTEEIRFSAAKPINRWTCPRWYSPPVMSVSS